MKSRVMLKVLVTALAFPVHETSPWNWKEGQVSNGSDEGMRRLR
jgi:hypothetical protein